MNTFSLHILTAERSFYEGECESLTVPTPEGSFGVLAQHTNTIAAVSTGVITFKDASGETVNAAVSGGLIRIEDNDVLILTDTAERAEEIDEIRAQRALEESRDILKQQKSMIEYSNAESRISRELNRIKLKKSAVQNNDTF